MNFLSFPLVLKEETRSSFFNNMDSIHLVFVILACLSMGTLVSSRVGVLTSTEEEEALRMWNKFCAGDSEEGVDGDTFVFCQRGKEEMEETLEHIVELTTPPEVARQVIFVQPPVYHYKHNVIINGQSGPKQNTTIYVLPQKTNHNILYNDTRQSDPALDKPVLYFLKTPPTPSSSNQSQDSNHEGDSNHGQESNLNLSDNRGFVLKSREDFIARNRDRIAGPQSDNDDFFEIYRAPSAARF